MPPGDDSDAPLVGWAGHQIFWPHLIEVPSDPFTSDGTIALHGADGGDDALAPLLLPSDASLGLEPEPPSFCQQDQGHIRGLVLLPSSEEERAAAPHDAGGVRSPAEDSGWAQHARLGAALPGGPGGPPASDLAAHRLLPSLNQPASGPPTWPPRPPKPSSPAAPPPPAGHRKRPSSSEEGCCTGSHGTGTTTASGSKHFRGSATSLSPQLSPPISPPIDSCDSARPAAGLGLLLPPFDLHGGGPSDRKSVV